MELRQWGIIVRFILAQNAILSNREKLGMDQVFVV